MPTYVYTALQDGRNKDQGTIVAASRREALQRLLDAGKNPLDIKEQSADFDTGGISFNFRRRGIRLATFNRQLATLSLAGTPIIKGLSVLSAQTKEVRARKILDEVIENVRSGSTLANALATHPSVFPQLMTSMIRIGETGGTLDQQLLQLSELYEKEEALKGEVQAALAYPLLVLAMGVLSVIILIVFFVPRLEMMFEVGDKLLPLPTRILLGLSHLITGHAKLLFSGVIVAGFGIRWALQKEYILHAIDRYKIRIPFFGDTILNLEIARFNRLLGTMTHAGVTIVEALKIVHPVLQNRAVARAVHNMVAQISTGTRLATLMEESALFPPLAVQMVATGEETGQLDEMLISVADTYDRETAASTKVMMSMLAPLLILFVAGIVGFILVSMILPIFQFTTLMK